MLILFVNPKARPHHSPVSLSFQQKQGPAVGRLLKLQGPAVLLVK